MSLFRPDPLSWVLAGLILFVVINVFAYSTRYLAGDRHQRSHLAGVGLFGATALLMVAADNAWLLLAAWAASNLLVVRLMIHKAEWGAARNSGMLALRTLLLGFVALAGGVGLLARNAETASIHQIIGSNVEPPLIALLLIGLAAMTQSAILPFHRWLTSSLNSPTPVSALMHAGMVNGGGFLLARFAPLYLEQPMLLRCLFIVGLATAVVGTLWKLVQTDIKRMLACSTIGQMGFMLMQCGMGLFAAAISHLCWHGLFKAYLFLSAGSSVQEKRDSLRVGALTPLTVLTGLAAGACGALSFVALSGTRIADSSLLMVALAFMAAAQLGFGVFSKPTVFRAVGSLIGGTGVGGLYGLSISLVEFALSPLQLMQPQPLDAVYLVGLAVIVLLWAAMLADLPRRANQSVYWKRFYMWALNASQPASLTVTAVRTSYQS